MDDPKDTTGQADSPEFEYRNGIRLLPLRDLTPVTDEFVNQLRDELGI